MVAAVLLLTGGLTAMQTFQLTTGLPFALILLAMCWSLYQALRADWQDDGMIDVARRQPAATVTDSAAGDGRVTSW